MRAEGGCSSVGAGGEDPEVAVVRREEEDSMRLGGVEGFWPISKLSLVPQLESKKKRERKSTLVQIKKDIVVWCVCVCVCVMRLRS